MKHWHIPFWCIILACQPAKKSSGDNLFTISIQNTSDDSLLAGIEIELLGDEGDFKLTNQEHQIIYQKDDFNSNGVTDHIFIRDQLGPGVSTYFARPGSQENMDKSCQVILAKDSSWIIFENDLIAYQLDLLSGRIAVFAKQEKQLIMQNESQRENHLVYLAEHGLGLAAPAVYDYERIVALSDAKEKKVKIVNDGPLRSLVEVMYNEVPYRGDLLNFVATFQQIAGFEYMDITVTATNNKKHSIKTALGISREAQSTELTQGKTENVSFAYTYGFQSEAGEILGLAILLPDRYGFENYQDDQENHILLCYPVQNTSAYRISASSVRLHDVLVDESQMIAKMRNMARDFSRELKISVRLKKPEN